MKITDVQAICLCVPYRATIADGCNCVTSRTSVLVKVSTDTDLWGIGEAVTFGGSSLAMRAVVEQQLAPLLIGEDPLNVEFLFQKMQWNNWGGGRFGLVKGGISGIDMALWDILGKAANMPISLLLGRHADRVASYASGGFYAKGKGLDDLKREMDGYLRMGYTAFKMKVGRTLEMVPSILPYMRGGDDTVSFQEDMRRIAAVREAVGPTGRVMIDMNCTWSVEAVLQAAPFFEEQRIFWIEEPVRTDDLAGYIRMKQHLPRVRIAGIENEQGLAKYETFLQSGVLDVVQMNLGWAGGFTHARRIAALAMAHNKPIAPHTFFSAVLHAANIHFAGAFPNALYIESEENENPLRTQLLKTPLEHDDHMNFFVPEGPGLGIELDWDVVETYAV